LLNSGAGGTGIAGRVTADGAGGFLFNAPINLMGDTTLTTLGSNITLNGHVQNADGVQYSLTLAAGSGSNRGDVSMTSGASESNPLNQFEVTSNRFNLSDTLWVQRYRINALGDVALSGHTLRGQDPGAANTMNAGGNVTGSTISLGRVEISSGGDITANVSGSDVAVTAQGDLNVVVTASHTATLSGDSVVATVAAPVVAVDAVHDAQISGSASNITVDAPSGRVTGDFGQVTNEGSGLVSVNGKPQGNQTLIVSSENNRVIPAGNTEPGERAEIQMAQAGDLTGQGLAPRSLSGPDTAGSFIDSGQAVELDLSPRNKRKKK
jgi:cytoskeletal protein CcmA (bactofilin family)